MTQKEKNILLRCGLFQGMEPRETEKLLVCLRGEKAHYEKNAIVWHMGDEIRACAVILSGALRAEAVNPAGEHTLIARHKAGGLVGDVLMATPGGTSPVYVIAEENTTLFFLPFGAVMGSCPNCCAAHGRLRENLIGEIARKYWGQRRRMRWLSEHSLRKRIAMYLLDRLGEGESGTLSLGIRREDLAEELCVNRSALSRELGRMKAEGLLDYYRDSFRIPSAAALRELL